MRQLSSTSTEYVAYRVTATDYTGAALNIGTDSVSIAFLAPGAKPTSSDWQSASWISSGVAGILVGPGGLTVAVGSYIGWVKVTDNPEIPVIPAGILEIY